MIKRFREIVKRAKENPINKLCCVVEADNHAIDAALHAMKENLCEPIFIGNEENIKENLSLLLDNEYKEIKEKRDLNSFKIINSVSLEESSKIAVNLINEKKADFILKGAVDTSILLKEVVNKEYGLSTGSIMSHVSFNEIESYHKLLVVTDGGMMMYPNVDQKQKIIENAVDVLIKLGYDKPKVSCLCAVEKVNPKMQETVDAFELKTRYLNNEIKNCIVEGPISLDLAIYEEAKNLKNFDSEVAGDSDILLVPNITCGNILGKSFTYAAKGKMAGFIVGAKCPIILTSRSSSAEEKFLSIALASLINA